MSYRVPKGCRCQTIYPGAVDEYTTSDGCPLHDERPAECGRCFAETDTAICELGKDELAMCDDCAAELDESQRRIDETFEETPAWMERDPISGEVP